VVEQCCSGQGVRTDKDKDEPSPVLYGKIKRENGVTAVAPPLSRPGSGLEPAGCLPIKWGDYLRNSSVSLFAPGPSPSTEKRGMAPLHVSQIVRSPVLLRVRPMQGVPHVRLYLPYTTPWVSNFCT
jgi:hypothetical protein